MIFDEYNEDEMEDENAIYDITTFGTSADVRTIYNRLSKKNIIFHLSKEIMYGKFLKLQN